MDLTREQMLAMHRSMVRIRLFEEAAGKLMETGKMPGFLHLYVGQEAVAVGVCEAIGIDDQITSTHRGHGHLVAKGGDLARMMAELMGKATGYCGGKGGSMHINDLSLGMLGANGVVGAGVPIAVGAGFRNKYLGTDQVAVAFFGDAATNIGAFHEAANMASALQLPVVFVCEHNMYGEYTPTERVMAVADVVERAAGYGMPGVIVDGMDVVAVHAATGEAVARARRGEGPSLIEAKTYRYYNHHGIQNLGLKYRPDDEVLAWKERDPIFNFEHRLIEGELATRDELDGTWDEIRSELDAAIRFAEESPFPDEQALLDGVFTGSDR
jgi:pyruvate dehydrogenase E1 component alpha subunit